MATPPDVDEMSPDEGMSRLINAGLREARAVGLGLPLVNALRDKFPEADLSTIGAASRTVGQAINAAALARAGGSDDQLDLDTMPALPSTMFTGSEQGRVLALADVTYEISVGEEGERTTAPKTWDIRTELPEDATFEELVQAIEEHFEAFQEQSPDFPMEEIVNVFINVYFMGKRF